MAVGISVVAPSFNQAKYFRACLQIVSQDVKPYEIIVVDGGSTDNSVEVIKEFEEDLHSWCSEPDGGQTHGIIKGFLRCTGDVLCFLSGSKNIHEGSHFAISAFTKRSRRCSESHLMASR